MSTLTEVAQRPYRAVVTRIADHEKKVHEFPTMGGAFDALFPVMLATDPGLDQANATLALMAGEDFDVAGYSYVIHDPWSARWSAVDNEGER